MAMYVVLLLLIGQWGMSHLKKPSVGFVFVTGDICKCHLRSLVMVRRVYGLLLTRSRMTLFKL